MIAALAVGAALLVAGQAAGTPKAPAAKPKPAAPRAAAASAAFNRIAADAASARDAGRLDDAIALYRKGIALRPSWDEGRWYLGSSLYERERFAEGRDAFAELVRRQPKHAGAVGMLGLCEFGVGKHEDALRTLLRARSLGVARNVEIARVVAFHTGILLTRFEEFEVGYAALAELVNAGMETPALTEALGLNVMRMPILPAAIPADRKPIVQLAGRAAVAMIGRRLSEATKLLDELVATWPREPNVHYARGLLRLTEAPDGALEDFRRELEVSPGHVPARLQIVFELVKRGEAADAKAVAEEAVRLDPSLFATHLALGQVWFETGDVARATAAFEHAVKLAPGSPQARFLLARAYSRAGRTAEAERERAEFRRLEDLKTSQAVPLLPPR